MLLSSLAMDRDISLRSPNTAETWTSDPSSRFHKSSPGDFSMAAWSLSTPHLHISTFCRGCTTQVNPVRPCPRAPQCMRLANCIILPLFLVTNHIWYRDLHWARARAYLYSQSALIKAPCHRFLIYTCLACVISMLPFNV